MRYRFGRDTGRRGAAVVELALTLPLLMFLFLATIDFARLFYYSVTVENCGCNAAVFASGTSNATVWQGPNGQVSTAQNAALLDATSLSPGLAASDVNVTNKTDADGNSVVVVTVTYTFRPLVAFGVIPASLKLVRTTQMRVAPATPS